MTTLKSANGNKKLLEAYGGDLQECLLWYDQKIR